MVSMPPALLPQKRLVILQLLPLQAQGHTLHIKSTRQQASQLPSPECPTD